MLCRTMYLLTETFEKIDKFRFKYEQIWIKIKLFVQGLEYEKRTDRREIKLQQFGENSKMKNFLIFHVRKI